MQMLKDKKVSPVRLQSYIRETLHRDVTLKPLKGLPGLPFFIQRLYDLFELSIEDGRCVVLVAHDTSATPYEVAKHVSLVRSAVDATVIFAASSLTAYNRSRLIQQGVGFIVPGNQLYIPEFAMDLREHFRSPSSRHSQVFSPAAQAVLFRHILYRDIGGNTVSAIAERLHYSVMSIGRVFDELAALKLGEIERHGNEKYLKFNLAMRVLFDSARNLLRSPVRAKKYVRSLPASLPLKRAGETALAELTDLSRPQTETYAVTATDWQSAVKNFNLIEVSNNESHFAVETWSYDPAGLSDGAVVDPLSLYAQFSNHTDERVSMAADRLLERIRW